ncbi:MAG: hypothetical protein OEM62_01135 [Acidobacteriota bacterium]|nr:hypothetical protein [Acidobacteriota bacterium]
MIRTTFRLLSPVLFLAAVFIPVLARAQDDSAAAEPQLAIEAVIVEPEKPGADTLCRLRIRILNRGERIASQLGFTVTINGTDIPVYSNQLFMFPLDPGTTSELALFNFWTTETSRPMPADGKLRIEVALREAQWTKIEMVEEVETWTPLGPVTGLPVSAAVTLSMTR